MNGFYLIKTILKINILIFIIFFTQTVKDISLADLKLMNFLFLQFNQINLLKLNIKEIKWIRLV